MEPQLTTEDKLQQTAGNLFDLGGRVALVTGGNGGIGLAIAIGLGQAGAKVMIAGRNEAKGAEAIETLSRLGVTARFGRADVSNESQCMKLADDTLSAFGRVDILVNNAGVTARKPPQVLSVEEWHTVLNSNLSSAFFCARAAYPMMKSQGGGKIIGIGSMYSKFASHFSAAYGASKGGLVQLTRSLAVAWAPDNIQANAILPGWIRTDMGKSVQKEVPGLREKVVARTPAGRWGEPVDLQGTAIFLASRASDFVTGTAIPVDGGYSSAG